MFSDKILEISFSDLSNKFATLDNKRGKSEDASDSKNSDFIGIICKDSNEKLVPKDTSIPNFKSCEAVMGLPLKP